MENELNNNFDNGENQRLLAELDLKDQLIEQLSQEIFRLVKINLKLQTETLVSDQDQAPEREKTTQNLLKEEQQASLYQEEIIKLQETVTNLTERNQTLEKLLEELPVVYREKFSAKMATVKAKIETLQRSNKQLYAELQSVSYRLAVRSRGQASVNLPQFVNKKGSSSIPTFGNV
jgi:DNA repair exonuclease SbcCD ATPase subunit